MKECSRCRESKELSQFHKHANTKGGYQAACISCRKKMRNRPNDNRIRREWATRNPIRNLHHCLKATAKRRGWDFDITEDDIAVPLRCPIFDVPLVMGGPRTDNHASVDRIDNSKGYVKGNVVVVCWRANRIKNDSRPGELRLIADYYESIQ